MKKYKELKTDKDFDERYGRKPGWKTCKHDWIDKRDNFTDEVYKVIQCKKCGLQDRLI